MSQLLVGDESIECDTEVDFVIESDVVEETFELTSLDLVIGEGVRWYKV